MAAKAERREIFFSLSRSIRYNCPHNINNNKNNTLTSFAKEDANTFHAFLHQIHAQRDRSFSISLSAKRERESAFVFPLLELRRDTSQFARNEREPSTNLLGTHKKIKKRKQ